MPTGPTIGQKLRENLAYLRSIGASQDELKAEIARAQQAYGKLNASEMEEANTLSLPQKAAVFGERAINSAGFGVGGLIGDSALAHITGRSFADIRKEREQRNEQLGAGWGMAADLLGGAVTGGASLNAIKGMANAVRLAKVGLAAGDAALQGGVTGAAEGLRDATAQGFANAGRAGMGGAVGGMLLGGTLGAAGGKGAQWLAGRRIAKQLAERGVNLKEAQAIASQLSDATPEAINAAMSRIDDFVRLGKGADVNAADAIGKEGGRALRAATNISKEGDALAGDRLRTRDANIVGRSRADVGKAAGFTPEQMDTFEQSLLKEQRDKANVSFANARNEGAAFDAANPFPRKKVEAAVPDDVDSFGLREIGGSEPAEAINPAHKLTEIALDDEIVQRKIGQLVSENPERYRNANKDEWAVMHKVYTRINEEIGKLKKNGNDVGDYYDGLLSAKAKIGDSLAARSDSFRPANAEFADIAQGVEAYKKGGMAASASLPSKARALQAGVAEGKEELFRKGNVDRLAEQMGIGPNAELGATARAKQGVGQQAIATRNAADKFRQIHGEQAYNDLIARAQAEGQFAATSNAVQGNSTTGKQLADMGIIPLAADVAGSLSVNPAWMATMFGRRIGSEALNGVMKRVASGKARTVADALTRGGSDNARSVLEDILAELARRDAAKRAGVAFGRKARTVTARMAGSND